MILRIFSGHSYYIVIMLDKYTYFMIIRTFSGYSYYVQRLRID
jgi:hypothetical protein